MASPNSSSNINVCAYKAVSERKIMEMKILPNVCGDSSLDPATLTQGSQDVLGSSKICPARIVQGVEAGLSGKPISLI